MSEEEKQCPFCKETIKAQAQKCRFCGNWINDSEQLTEVSCSCCGEKIPSSADVCPFCGEVVNQNSFNMVYNNFSKSSFNITTVVAQVLSAIITLCLIIWGISYIFKDEPTVSLPLVKINPIDELISGCTDNGDSGGLEYRIIYYCKDKLWKGVQAYKGLQEKFYNYNVFDNNDDVVASYTWQDGDYICEYAWINGSSDCSASEFVKEVKRGLQKRIFTTKDVLLVENTLIQGCSHSESGYYSKSENITFDTYKCTNKPWDTVLKMNKPQKSEFSYTLFEGNEGNYPTSTYNEIAEITWQWGEYVCKYKGDSTKYLCNINEFTEKSKQISASRKNARYVAEQKRLQRIEQEKQARIRAEQRYREQRRYEEAQSFF